MWAGTDRYAIILVNPRVSRHAVPTYGAAKASTAIPRGPAAVWLRQLRGRPPSAMTKLINDAIEISYVSHGRQAPMLHELVAPPCFDSIDRSSLNGCHAHAQASWGCSIVPTTCVRTAPYSAKDHSSGPPLRRRPARRMWKSTAVNPAFTAAQTVSSSSPSTGYSPPAQTAASQMRSGSSAAWSTPSASG